MMIGVCFAGAMTFHGLMAEVLANRPERVVPGVDGYIALVECRNIGRRFTLLIQGKQYRVAVADCATSQPVGQWPTKRTLDGRTMPYLGDVSNLPGLGQLASPTPALLCPVNDG